MRRKSTKLLLQPLKSPLKSKLSLSKTTPKLERENPNLTLILIRGERKCKTPPLRNLGILLFILQENKEGNPELKLEKDPECRARGSSSRARGPMSRARGKVSPENCKSGKTECRARGKNGRARGTTVRARGCNGRARGVCVAWQCLADSNGHNFCSTMPLGVCDLPLESSLSLVSNAI
jgi:hypothetical protein